MYRHAWHSGLKTTYYLRTLGASNIEKATVSVKKEIRGVAAGGASAEPSAVSVQSSASVSTPPMATASASSSEPPAPAKRVYTAEEKRACSIEAMKRGEECEACQ
jgi:ribonucleoside-diphosphate reductase alpha chain